MARKSPGAAPDRNDTDAEHRGEKTCAFQRPAATCRNVWTIATQPFSGAHFATMPAELAERCIKRGHAEHGVCAACGTPWKRIAQRGQSDYARLGKHKKTRADSTPNGYGQTRNANGVVPSLRARPVITTDWKRGCRCQGAGVSPRHRARPVRGRLHHRAGRRPAGPRRHRHRTERPLLPHGARAAEDDAGMFALIPRKPPHRGAVSTVTMAIARRACCERERDRRRVRAEWRGRGQGAGARRRLPPHPARRDHLRPPATLAGPADRRHHRGVRPAPARRSVGAGRVHRLEAALDAYAKASEPWATRTAWRMLHEVERRDKQAWRSYTEGMGEALRREIASFPTGETMQRLLGEQVSLITSLPREASQRVHALTLQALSTGVRAPVRRTIRWTPRGASCGRARPSRSAASRRCCGRTPARALSARWSGWRRRTCRSSC
jgi:hypothetical protein